MLTLFHYIDGSRRFSGSTNRRQVSERTEQHRVRGRKQRKRRHREHALLVRRRSTAAAWHRRSRRLHVQDSQTLAGSEY